MPKTAITILDDWSPAHILRLREMLGMTQVDLAKILYAHARSVKRWEAGDTLPLPLYVQQFEQLAKERLTAEQLRELREMPSG